MAKTQQSTITVRTIVNGRDVGGSRRNGLDTRGVRRDVEQTLADGHDYRIDVNGIPVADLDTYLGMVADAKYREAREQIERNLSWHRNADGWLEAADDTTGTRYVAKDVTR